MFFQCRQFQISVVAISLLSLLFIMAGCSSKQEAPPAAEKKPAALEKLTISYGGPLPTLLAIAADQGYFAREGVEVTVKNLILGKNAFEDMLAGGSDFAVVAETPLVIRSFTKDDYRIITTLASTANLNRIVMRRDRGGNSITALKGRRVATVKGVVPHYFLDLQLAKEGLSEKDIVPLFLESSKLEAALLDGSVDAISATANIAQSAMNKLGSKVSLLETPGLCLTYSFLVTSKGYSASSPERVEKLIRAFHAAELFNRQFPDKSREIVMAATKISREEYNAVWSGYSVRLALDNALLLTLEEQARWAMDKGFVKGDHVPNYLDFIDAAPLKKVAPEAVRLKR